MAEQSFLAEVLEMVAAANALVREREERAMAAGRSVYSMHDGFFYERNRDGVYQIAKNADGEWKRIRAIA